jgi:hypothetical protein
MSQHRWSSLCGPCINGWHTGPGKGGTCEDICHVADLAEAHRRVREDLILLAAPVADRVREMVDAAVQSGDAEAIRREGHDWSGGIARSLLGLADLVEAHARKLAQET